MTKSSQNVTLLEWDTEHFGFPVARIERGDLDEVELEQAVRKAGDDGMRLVYWFGDAGRPVSNRVLEAHGGVLVDRRVTYRAGVDRLRRDSSNGRGDAEIREYPQSAANDDLLALGVLAGGLSRFRVDPRIARDRFEDLFHRWVDRSARREIADAVFVAEGDERKALGFVTVARRGGTGVIGLISVAPEAQGRGLGLRLMDAAHGWMSEGGMDEAMVVTQLDNVAACRLYERAGYEKARVEHVYHFWPGANVNAG